MAKGILFDFVGTIARHSDGRLEPFLREVRNLGYDVYGPELQAAHDFVLHVDAPRRGHEGSETILEAVLKHLGLKPKRTELMALAPVFAELHRFELHEDAARAVPALAKSRKVGIVSGLPAFLVKPVLEPLKAAFALITPKEAKASMPHPKVFHAGAQALALRPRDVVVVSADCEDGLAVPKSLGFRTVHVRRQGDAMCPHALVSISSLDELEGVLKPAPPKASAPAPVVAAKA